MRNRKPNRLKRIKLSLFFRNKKTINKRWKRKKTDVKSSQPQKVIEKRKEAVKRRRSFILSLPVILLLWSSIVAIVYFVDPDTPFVIALFFVLLLIALAFTLSFIFVNTRRGITATGVIIIFLLLRYFGVGNVLNLILLTGIAINTELYFKNTS